MHELQVYEGILRIEADNVAIEQGGQVRVLAEPGTGVWIMLYGCAVRAHTRNGFIERVESTANDCMYREVGPIESMRGTIVTDVYPAGSMLAGSIVVYFESGGIRYGVIGGNMPTQTGGQEVTVRVRKLSANLAYAARATEYDVFFEAPSE